MLIKGFRKSCCTSVFLIIKMAMCILSLPYNMIHFLVSVKLAEDSKVRPFILYGGPLLKSKYVFHDLHFHWAEDEFGSEHEIDNKK